MEFLKSDTSVKIYVFYYKEGLILNIDKMFQPIMAGNALIRQTAIPGDDTGENISALNPYYSELTGIYWVWKNTWQDITGVCHYRRYFTAQPEPFFYKLKRFGYYPIGLYKKRYGLIYTKNTGRFSSRIINEQELKRLLDFNDVILPVARKLKYTVETHYRRYHDINDLNLVKALIAEKYPDFQDSFKKVLEGKKLYANNIFILKNDLFQEFMNWWFDILFEYQQRIDLTSKTGYQKRNIGFIAERLLNVWFMKKQLKCVELPVIYFKKFKNS
jgi:Domain of unknown function (DUF4422)